MRTEFKEETIRYLEMIQTVITRMGANCFSLKSWTVTLVAGILAVTSTLMDKKYVSTSLIPVLVFWFLDTYYLQKERKYRALFNLIREDDSVAIDFNLNPVMFVQHIPDGKNLKYITCLFSNIEIFFYLPIGIIVLLFLTNVI